MAVNTFASHLSELGARLQELDNLLSDIDQIMQRHVANGYSGLASPDFDGQEVTKAQYDNVTSSMDNLINTWRLTNNTNIQQYLYEIP